MSDEHLSAQDPGEPPVDDSTSGKSGSTPSKVAEPAAERVPAEAAKAEKAADSGTAEKKKDRPKRKRWTWKKRFTVLLVTLIALGVMFRVAIQVAFPLVVKSVGEQFGFDVSVDRVRFGVIGDDVAIGRLVVVPRYQGKSDPSQQPLVQLEYVRATISPLALLTGKLKVWRVQADGVELNVERNAKGEFPAIEHIIKQAGLDKGKAPETAAASKSASPATFDLTAPLSVDALRLDSVRLKLTDRTVSPPVQTVVHLDLRVSDIGSATTPSRMEMEVRCDDLLDILHVEGEGRAAGSTLEGKFDASLRGLHLKPRAQFLEPLGIRPLADSISATAKGRINTTAAGLLTAMANAAAATRPGTKPATAPALAAATTQPGFTPGKPAESLACQLELTSLALWADTDEVASCRRVFIDATKVNPATADFSSIVIEGVRGQASRSERGRIRVAGLEIIPVAAPPTTKTRPDSIADKKPVAGAKSPATKPGDVQFRASLGLLAIRDVKFRLEDRWASPEKPLAFEVDELSLRDVVLDPAKPDSPIAISGRCRLPGIARTLSIDGVARPFAERKTLDLTFSAEGIAPKLLRPYLDMAGLESLLTDAMFSGKLVAGATIDDDGRVKADVRLGRIDFVDAGNRLLSLDDVKLAGVTVDVFGGLLRFDSIEVQGPEFKVRRDVDGSLAGFGFHTKTPTPAPPRDPDPPSPPSDMKLVRLEIGKFSWKNVKVTYDDLAANPPQNLKLGDAGVELSNFVFDLENTKPADKPGKFTAFLVAPGLADYLGVTGTLTPTPSSLTADVAVTGRGITARSVSGYLKSVGVEPTLEDGSLTARARVAVAAAGGGIKASVYAEDILYKDEERELAGVDLLMIDEVLLDPAARRLAVGAVYVAKPRATVRRDADGVLAAGGFRLVGPATRPTEDTPAVAAKPAAPAPAAVATKSSTVAPAAPAAPAPMVMTLRSLSVVDSAISWSDLASRLPVNTTLHADLALSSVTLGKEAPPATLMIRASGDELFGNARITGTVEVGPKRQGTNLSIVAEDVRGTALAGYLPPGIKFALNGGNFSTRLAASVAEVPAGGIGAKLLIDAVDWRDRDDSAILLAVDRVEVDVPRVDIAGGVINVNKIAVYGVELDALHLADGTIKALGLAVIPARESDAAPAATPTAQQASPPVAAAPVAAPANAPVAVAPATQPAGPTVDAATLVARAKEAYPLLKLTTLDLHLRRFSITDLSHPNSQPMSVLDLRFRNTAPVEMLGKQPEQNPPLKVELTGKVDPIIGGIDVKLQSTPLAGQPMLTADVALTNIRGQGITEVMPVLADVIDGSQLQHGEFRTNVELSLANLDRRGAGKVNFMAGFDVDLVVSKIFFREAPDKPVAVGLDEFRVNKAVIRPAKGTLRIASIELLKPIASAVRDEQGIHVAGLLVKMPKHPATQPTTSPAQVVAATQPSTAPAIAKLPPPPATQPTTGPTPPKPKPEGEIAVGRLIISSADVRIEDRSVNPPVLIPITSIDLDVRGISSLAMYEERPLRFSAQLSAGKVTLPKKIKGGLIGAAGDLLKLGGGDKKTDTAPETESRELFAQIAASGNVLLYPRTYGVIKADVSGFELASISGIAKESGVTLGYGTFDLALEARGETDGSLFIKAMPAITDLSVKEPAGGPIMRFLGPVAPDLDTAIFALESADKSISLPVEVKVKPKQGTQIGPDDVEGIPSAIAGAVTSVIAKAIASTPVKAVTGVTSVIGLDTVIPGMGPQKPEEPVVITFLPGHAGLEPAEAAKLATVLQKLRADAELQAKISSDIGNQDLVMTESRANPAGEDAAALATSLRRRRQELQAARVEVAAEARYRLATVGDTEAAAAMDRLRAIDRELARVEDAMDRTYDLFRPGADRQAPRRARAAAIDLSRDRLSFVRQTLQGGLPLAEATRVTADNPRLQPTDAPGSITIKLVRVKKQ